MSARIRRIGCTRRTVVSSVLATSVVLGSTAALMSSAHAAVPAATCTVTPSANGTSVTITGEGFTPPRNLNDGESTEPLNIGPNGNFRLTRFQKNVDYTVVAVNDDQNFVFVNCNRVPAAQQPSPETMTARQLDYANGYAAGFSAGNAAAKKDCSSQPTPDKSQTHSDDYWNGWTAAAKNAIQAYCAHK